MSSLPSSSAGYDAGTGRHTYTFSSNEDGKHYRVEDQCLTGAFENIQEDLMAVETAFGRHELYRFAQDSYSFQYVDNIMNEDVEVWEFNSSVTVGLRTRDGGDFIWWELTESSTKEWKTTGGELMHSKTTGNFKHSD